MIRSRLIVIPLFDKLRITTAGNTYGAGTTVFVELDIPDFTHILPQAEELTLVSLTENPTAFLKWNIFFQSGYTRSTELTTGTPPFPLVAAGIAGAGSVRYVPYTTITNFLLESRLLLGYGNSSGALFESAVCSATLLVKTIGT